MTTFQAGAVILGAGASSRMGRPKLLLPWNGTTVIGHVILQWQRLGAAQIAVVLRPADSELGQELDRPKFSATNRIPNPQPERGMFSSIVCAAAWTGWQADISHIAIVLGDQPHLLPGMLGTMLEFAAKNPHAISQPAFNGCEKHPVILPRPAFLALQNSRAESLKDFLKTSGFPRALCTMSDAGLNDDLDTPQDYFRLRKQ